MKKDVIHVLVIDDDQDDYFMLKDLLRQISGQKFELEWAYSYEMGISALSKKAHDICFLDYRLGAHTGLDLLKEMVPLESRLPIILLTGYGEHEVDQEAMRIGAADYLIKDEITPSLLERSIRYTIHHIQNRENIRSLLDSTFEGIVVHTGEGVILEINRVGAQIFNHHSAEMIGTHLSRYFSPDAIPILNRTIESMSSITNEITGITRENAPLSLEISSKPYPYQGTAARLTSIRDITSRKQMEAQILMQDRLASVGLLASSLAHEIGTPLGVIRGRAEYLAIQTAASTPPIQKNVDVIISQIDRVTHLIRSLLNLARGDQTRKSNEVNLSQIVNEVLDLMGHELRKHSIQIQNHLTFHLPISVRAEGQPLHQVILNLLVNSVHAIESAIQSGRNTDHFIRIQAKIDNGYCTLSVEDSGCGISKTNMKNLFKPFFTTKEIGLGTGLGLATSYRIVESWSGHIQVESQEGVGTLFRILIPVK